MKTYFFVQIIIAFLFTACNNTKTTNMQSAVNYPFYVGTYTKGNSEGVYKYVLNADGSIDSVGLAAKVANPSFVALSKDGLYLLAIDEVSIADSGIIASFKIEADSLVLINRSLTGGVHPCHISINKSGYVLTSNYGSGSMGLLQLNAQGQLSTLMDFIQHEGSGPVTSRQLTPHAHSSWFSPIKNQVISVDLGTDELWLSSIDTVNNKLDKLTSSKLLIAEGAGPRHLAFHPNNKWMYVLNELNCTVTLLTLNTDETWEVGSVISTLPDTFTNQNTCADIHVSKDGRFVYASNRGHNSIVIYQVNEGEGTLSLVGFESTHGEVPRNFALSPTDEFLIVANQNSDNLVSFARDENTGLLTFVAEVNAPMPVCIAFR